MATPRKNVESKSTPKKRHATENIKDDSGTEKKKKKSAFTEIDLKFHLKDSSTIFVGMV